MGGHDHGHEPEDHSVCITVAVFFRCFNLNFGRMTTNGFTKLPPDNQMDYLKKTSILSQTNSPFKFSLR